MQQALHYNDRCKKGPGGREMDDARDVTRPLVVRAAGVGPPLRLPVRDIRATNRFRVGPINPDHVIALAAGHGTWPPILIDRACTVIDGAHRLHAAVQRGFEDIACEVFEGSEEEAFVEFVRRNVHHGLSLTLQERRMAAVTIIGTHKQWSDRRIAELCALAPGTVAALRRAGAAGPHDRPTDQNEQCDRRIGRDGRSRPVSSHAITARVMEAIQREPNASLRTIARPIGVSPETVRRVKARMLAARRTTAATGDGAPPMARPGSDQP